MPNSTVWAKIPAAGTACSRVARHLDRAAEHVHEQQHEHDRLDRGEDQQLGAARHRAQVAQGLGPAVAPAATRRPSGRRVRAALVELVDRRADGDVGTRSSRPALLDLGGVVLVLVFLRGVAGEREEHVVERRPAAPRRRRPRTPAASSSRTTSGTMPGAARTGTVTVRARVVDASAPQARSASTVTTSSSRRRRRRRSTSTRSPPMLALQLVGVPRAMTAPWSMTMISSARRSASSRYCVVSSVVVPPRRPAPR